MSQPFSLVAAASFLSLTFDDLVGGKSEVMFLGHDQQGRMTVAVTWPGDELVRAMQVEAFLVDQGEAIVHRSQKKNGKTLLVYKIKNRPQQ